MDEKILYSRKFPAKKHYTHTEIGVADNGFQFYVFDRTFIGEEVGSTVIWFGSKDFCEKHYRSMVREETKSGLEDRI